MIKTSEDANALKKLILGSGILLSRRSTNSSRVAWNLFTCLPVRRQGDPADRFYVIERGTAM